MRWWRKKSLRGTRNTEERRRQYEKDALRRAFGVRIGFFDIWSGQRGYWRGDWRLCAGGRRRRIFTDQRAGGELRVVYGSIERFIGILIENYAGAFPVWLAPVQVKILPITDKHHDYAYELKKKFFDAGIRVEVDARNEKMGYKIREAQVKKIPYALVVGDQEVADGTVNVRKYGEKDSATMKADEFLAMVQEKIKTRDAAY